MRQHKQSAVGSSLLPRITDPGGDEVPPGEPLPVGVSTEEAAEGTILRSIRPDQDVGGAGGRPLAWCMD